MLYRADEVRVVILSGRGRAFSSGGGPRSQPRGTGQDEAGRRDRHRAGHLELLVNRVVPRGRLMDEALLVARRIAPPHGVQDVKKLINDAYERTGFIESMTEAWSAFRN